MSLRFLVNSVSAAECVRSWQGRFCVLISTIGETAEVVQASRIRAIKTIMVGLVRFLCGLFGVGVGRAHLRVSAKHGILDKQRGIDCLEGFRQEVP